MRYTRRDYQEALPPALLALGILCLALLISSCEGAWYYVKPVRQSRYQGFQGSIYSRMPANYAAVYDDRNLSTSAHEGTHGLNALIRNNPQKGWSTSTHQACFVPDFGGQCDAQVWVGKQPQGVTLSQIARYCQGTASSSNIQTYLINAQRDWNNQPLYIFDELTAYCNSSYVQIQQGNPTPSQLSHDIQLSRAMLGWSDVIVQLSSRRGNDTRDLQEFLDWMRKYVSFLERSTHR